MSPRIKKLIGKLMPKAKKREDFARPNNQTEPDRRVYRNEDLAKITVSSSLSVNLDRLKRIFGQNADVIFRQFRLGLAEQTEAAIVHIESMCDKALINSDVLKPMMLFSQEVGCQLNQPNLLKLVKDFIVTSTDLQEAHNLAELVNAILYGKVVILIDGQDTALILGLQGWSARNITEPTSETVVRGPREGFVETLSTNLSLIRRRVQSPNLVFERLNIGRVTSTPVMISYIKGITSPDLVAEVKRRLQRIDLDAIIESGALEELIEDAPFSPFPTVLHTERPDMVASALIEGRVAILTEGTPFALIVPADFFFLLQSPEDYSTRFVYATVIRWLRYLGMFTALLLPSLYIAVTTFHQEMIPTRLLLSIAAAREGVPFPALLEALIMELAFEAIREAGIRLPRQVGQAVSIVGALVLGQAAIQASIVSPLMVIVVALTGIASFMMPIFTISFPLRLMRFGFMLLAGILGLFGIIVGFLAVLIHLAGLRSFGMPYLAPLAPLHGSDLKDVLIRAPIWAMNRRPTETAKTNQQRQVPGLKPSPAQPNKGQKRRGGQTNNNDQ